MARVLRAEVSAGLSEPDQDSVDSMESLSRTEQSYGKARPLHLEEDIFGHVVVTYFRHGSILDDKIRAIALMTLVLVGQLCVACAVTRHCISTIDQVEEDLALAVGVSYDATDCGGSTIMQRVCGFLTSETEPIAGGFGTAFHDKRLFDTFGRPTSRLEQLHYQLRVEFQLVFASVAVFWAWRCFSELRTCWKEALAFLLYEHIVEHHKNSHSEAHEWKMTEAEDSVLEPSIDVHHIRRMDQCFALVIMSLRFIVALLLLSSGYLLLCMSGKIIDLVLNAVALEFIFDIDGMIVKAMLSRKEDELLSAWEFDAPSGLLKTLDRHSGHFGFSRRQCAGWRCRDWLRLLSLFVIVFLLVWPHNLKVRALHSQARVICLTSGLTDGMARFPSDLPDDFVVFPVQAFCGTFVNNFIQETYEPLCGAWRLKIDGDYSIALCTNPFDIERASWYSLRGLEFEIRKDCLSMWFGKGVQAGAPVPALARSASQTPEMFGCRAKDLKLNVRQVWWPAFRGGFAKIVTMDCLRPAYGPRSAAWGTTPLDSTRELSPSNFFRNDPRSPIERQVGACAALEGVRYCAGNPCMVVSEGRGHSCEQVCATQGLACAEAFATNGSCPASGSVGSRCTHVFPVGADPVCRCELPPKPRRCGLLPHARARCAGDPCKVLVSRMDFSTGRQTKYRDCNEYCGTANLGCIAQHKVVSHSCKVRGDLACGQAFPEQPPAAMDQQAGMAGVGPQAHVVASEASFSERMWRMDTNRIRRKHTEGLEAFVHDADDHRVCVCTGASEA